MVGYIVLITSYISSSNKKNSIQMFMELLKNEKGKNLSISNEFLKKW
jgi:hypothetical protein